MPIHPDNRARYPKEWPEISHRIRFGRAAGQCECLGECGHDHGGRCGATHGDPHPHTGSKVVLTTGHRNHVPEDCRDENLAAWCQKCHLSHDRHHHAASRRARAESKREAARVKAAALHGTMAFQVECATGRRVLR